MPHAREFILTLSCRDVSGTVHADPGPPRRADASTGDSRPRGR
jgi:hypothetical protein